MRFEPTSEPDVYALTIRLTDAETRRSLTLALVMLEQLDRQCCGSAPRDNVSQSSKPGSRIPAHDPAALAKARWARRQLESIAASIEGMGAKVRVSVDTDWTQAEVDAGRRVRAERRALILTRKREESAAS